MELLGHTGEVCGLKWRNDGEFLASGGNVNVVNIWDGRLGDVTVGEGARGSAKCETTLLLSNRARNMVTTIPEFYFNFENSNFGHIIPSPTSGSRPLPFSAFLATPLLPCGPLNPKIEKFTGNGILGPADSHIAKAIHAFVHFSVLYSQNSVLFCDLQGPDRYGVMCLIDPQSHTTNPVHQRNYWDKGPREITCFEEQHLPHCSENWVCKSLNLANLVFEPEDDKSESQASSPPKKKKKMQMPTLWTTS